MRIRRKKNFNSRFEQVKDYVIVPERDLLNVKDAIKDKKPLDFNKIFNNDNPVCLEIGCGKGGFIIKLAKKYPNYNFIAVEMLDNIILMASENVKNENLKNVVFFNSGAEYLERYILENSIDKIFLNFSPPYPQKSYENRRLTNDILVQFYKKALKDNGSIYQKTDDVDFFEYSKEKFIENGFSVIDYSVITDTKEFLCETTEYEEKFRKLGVKINGLIATKI